MDELLSKLSTDPALIDTLDKDGLLEAADVLTAYVTSKAESITSGTSDNRQADLEAGKEARERLDRVRARLTEINEQEATQAAEAAALTEGLTPPSEEIPTPAETEETVEVEEVVEEPAIVASQPSLGKIAARRGKEFIPPAPKPNALVASVGNGIKGVSRFENGIDVARAAIAQHKELGSLRPEGTTSYPIARFEYDHGYEVFNQESDYGVIEQAKADEVARIKGNIDRTLGRQVSALTAAIPVPCGPVEPLYEYFSISTRDGLLQVPTVNARRGALSYPVSPSQASIVGVAEWTAAVAVAWDEAAPKPYYLVECGTNGTCTVVPYPTRIRFRNWEARFNPEYVAHVMAETLTLHAHKMNAVQIAAIRTLATNSTITPQSIGGGIVTTAQSLSFAAAKYRELYKMGQEAPLTVLAPFWVRDALASDLMTRSSTLSLENARARATALFAGFNLDVQWLYDTQVLTAANFYPGTADFTIYAPGTFVRLDGGGLNIAETRDSTLNGLNQFEFFAETSEVICQVGHAAWDIIAVPVCPSGITGGSVTTIDCTPAA